MAIDRRLFNPVRIGLLDIHPLDFSRTIQQMFQNKTFFISLGAIYLSKKNSLKKLIGAAGKGQKPSLKAFVRNIWEFCGPVLTQLMAFDKA